METGGYMIQGDPLAALFFFLSVLLMLVVFMLLTKTNQGEEIMIEIGSWLLRRWPWLRCLA